jgi:flagellar basal-body rod protein FlgB
VLGRTLALLRPMLDPLGKALEGYMDVLSYRQKLIASNVANADTPGYKTKDIDFQSELRNVIDGSPTPVEVTGLKTNNDGNNVSLDREARLLSENALRFNLATQLMRGQFSTLRSAIEEGRNG